MDEFRTKQAAFEKETGQKGMRFDAITTGDQLPAEGLIKHVVLVGDFQHKNMVEHGGKVKYGGTMDYLQHEGEQFDLPDKPPQIKLMTPKECFSNATTMMLRNSTKYDYCEGVYASAHLPFPIDHAWLADKKTGTVVDPTLGWQPKARYFGVAYPKMFVMKKMLQNKYYGLHSDGAMMNDVVLGTDKDMKYGRNK